MDFLKKLPQLLMKYRYAVLVLLVGLVLMILPTGKKEQEQTSQTNQAVQITELSAELETILEMIQGVGRVEVLLTVEYGQEEIFQTDNDETVIITGSDRTEAALIQKVKSPQYRGAVVVCQGADSPSVRLNIINAVANATGLTTDKITVLKMK